MFQPVGVDVIKNYPAQALLLLPSSFINLLILASIYVSENHVLVSVFAPRTLFTRFQRDWFGDLRTASQVIGRNRYE